MEVLNCWNIALFELIVQEAIHDRAFTSSSWTNDHQTKHFLYSGWIWAASTTSLRTFAHLWGQSHKAWMCLWWASWKQTHGCESHCKIFSEINANSRSRTANVKSSRRDNLHNASPACLRRRSWSLRSWPTDRGAGTWPRILWRVEGQASWLWGRHAVPPASFYGSTIRYKHTFTWEVAPHTIRMLPSVTDPTKKS